MKTHALARFLLLTSLALPLLSSRHAAAATQRAALRASSLSPRLRAAVDLGRAPAGERHDLVVSLDLRSRDRLEDFLRDVQNPASPRYHRFLTQSEFNTLHAPTPAEEEAVLKYVKAQGLDVTDRVANRLTISVTGSVAAIERAFGVAIHRVLYQGKPHFAAVNEPSLPADLARYVVGVVGLDDLGAMEPDLVDATGNPINTGSGGMDSSVVDPSGGSIDTGSGGMGSNTAGGGGGYAFAPMDLDLFYDNDTPSLGARQTIIVAGVYAWDGKDVKTFSSKWGLPSLDGSQVCTGPGGSPGCLYDASRSLEVSLGVEYAHATAPRAKIQNYMARSTSFPDFTVMYNRVVLAGPGRIVTTTWGACETAIPVATQVTNDNIFANANARGQSWFAASGDGGSRPCDGVPGVRFPANSPHVIGVGGTTPHCSAGLTAGDPACHGYGSESGWSHSGGGVSQVFRRPAFQAGCGVPEVAQRLVPDVALEADPVPGKYVVHGGTWHVVGGTSGAAPQWAGFFAELAEQQSGAALGNPGARLYALCGTGAYHDVTTGTNGDYSATAGYDLVTGLGSIDARIFFATY